MKLDVRQIVFFFRINRINSNRVQFLFIYLQALQLDLMQDCETAIRLQNQVVANLISRSEKQDSFN